MKRINIYLVLLVVFFSSCQKDEDKGDDMVYYHPVVEVEGSATGAQTRVAIENYTGANNYTLSITQYGLWVQAVNDDGTTPNATNSAWYYNRGYDNIKVAGNRRYQTWNFSLRNASEANSRLGLFKSKGKVRLYGMHPHYPEFNPAASTKIPFELGSTDATNYDYMYTGPVLVDPSVTTELNSTITFKHAMTALEFRMTTMLRGILTIKEINIQALDNANNPVNLFYTKGDFDVANGQISNLSSATDKLTIEYNKVVRYGGPGTDPLGGDGEDIKDNGHNGYTPYTFIFPEVTAFGAAKKIKMTIVADYKGSDEDGDKELVGYGSTLTYSLDDIQIDGGAAITGFQKEYRYIFPIKIDNFIKYHAGYPTIQPWGMVTDADGNEIETEIKF